MPRLEVYALDHSLTEGVVLLAFARWRENGVIEAASVTVDLWCQGISTTDFEEVVDEDDWRDFRNHAFNHEIGEEIWSPACARSLVEAAEAYGRTNGFSPPADFRKARRILNSADASACARSWDFGRDGKPHFVPLDDLPAERLDAILTRLAAIHGENGFTWEDPLSAEAQNGWDLPPQDEEAPLDDGAAPPPAPVSKTPPPPQDAAAIDAALREALKRLKS